MEAKEYLQQIRTLTVKIRQRTEEVEELREAAMSIGSPAPDKEKIQSSGVKDTTAEKIAKYADMAKDIDNMILELACTKHRIIDEIHQLSDAKYIEILYKRYVQLKRWELIAIEMSYDYDYVRALDSKALQAFSETVISTHTITQTDEL